MTTFSGRHRGDAGGPDCQHIFPAVERSGWLWNTVERGRELAVQLDNGIPNEFDVSNLLPRRIPWLGIPQCTCINLTTMWSFLDRLDSLGRLLFRPPRHSTKIVALFSILNLVPKM
jgi:hypothetical protein